MKNGYFDETNDFLNSVTQLYKVFWPALVGFSNLRAEYLNQISKNPNITKAELNSNLCEKSILKMLNGGLDFEDVFAHSDFEEQKNEIGWLCLNDAIALYDGWVTRISKRFYPGDTRRIVDTRKSFSKCLNSPNEFDSDFTSMTSGRASVFMQSNFQYRYLMHKKSCDYDMIINLLKCFLVYKSYRNCYMHNGRCADELLIERASEYATVASTSSLPVKKVPVFRQQYLNQPIVLDLETAVQIGDILIRLVVSFDALLVNSDVAEQAFIERFSKSKYYHRVLKTDKNAALRQLDFYINCLGLPTPLNNDDVMRYLLNNKLLCK